MLTNGELLRFQQAYATVLSLDNKATRLVREEGSRVNKKVLEDKLESLQLHYNLSNEHVKSQIIKAQIELLETLIEAFV